jgi:hypothetical protein
VLLLISSHNALCTVLRACIEVLLLAFCSEHTAVSLIVNAYIIILCSLFTHVPQLAKTLPKDKIVLVNLCGRGDKDMHTVAKYVLQIHSQYLLLTVFDVHSV